MMLRCPVCNMPIVPGETVWRCAQGHSFDVARQGYVNLLPVQQKHSLHPGDTPEQVRARRRFLGAGFYAPIAAAVCELLGPARRVLDVGCGEGYYLRQFGQAHPEAERWGLDISRDAVRLAAGADKAGHYLVATAARLPFKIAYGSVSVNSSTSAYIDYSSAGFTSVPYVLINYSTANANWTGTAGAIKVHSKTTSGAYATVGGSYGTLREADWIAIGI